MTQHEALPLPVRSRTTQPRLVCVCGSARFRRAFEEVNRRLTGEGCIVVTIEHEADDAQHDLTEVDVRKITMCDELFVLNVNGYIDERTRHGICLAQRHGRALRFLEELDWAKAPTRVRASTIPGWVVPDDAQSVEEGTVLDLRAPFRVVRGAVLLYGPDETRAACTLVADHVWPGIEWVPEVWYAEAASHTVIARFDTKDPVLLRPIGELLRWAVGTSGQVWERMLWGLFVVGSVATQEELSSIIGCRRESVTAAMREFRAESLIEKRDGRLRLTAKGLAVAAKLCTLEREDNSAPPAPLN